MTCLPNRRSPFEVVLSDSFGGWRTKPKLMIGLKGGPRRMDLHRGLDAIGSRRGEGGKGAGNNGHMTALRQAQRQK